MVRENHTDRWLHSAAASTKTGRRIAGLWTGRGKILNVALAVLVSVIGATRAHAVEGTWSYAVQVSAVGSESPNKITLSWPTDTVPNYTSPTPSSFNVYRKAVTDTSWTLLTTTPLAGTATSYEDANGIAVGTAYDYKVVKAYSGANGYGYVRAGIKVPLVEARGKVLLITGLTATEESSLATELARLVDDLVGDGWIVARQNFLPTDSVANVKTYITNAYNADPTNVKAVFLLGRVPVPYSGLWTSDAGNRAPDGHYAPDDHSGAWPADVYYGVIGGSWTDTGASINAKAYPEGGTNSSGAPGRLSNVPGDGKFDQKQIPAPVVLQVGRVDFTGMVGQDSWDPPNQLSFPSPTELLRRYLNKEHAYRQGQIAIQRRAIVYDGLGVRQGEAMAASGFRSFAPIVGAAQVRNLMSETNDTQGTWYPIVSSSGGDYLLSWIGGSGSSYGVNGPGSPRTGDVQTIHRDVVNGDVRTAFNLMLGSWFGDWDQPNDFMRAFLATPTYGLAAMWSGRPHWFLHPLGLGETLGFCTQLTQNNTTGYENQVNNYANNVHIALMGDPTLRLFPVAPPTAVTVSSGSGNAVVSWTASTEPTLAGYHVYRASSSAGPFTRVTTSLVTGTSFTHTGAPSGAATYLVRAVKLETTASGTYYNPSQGAFWSGTIGGGDTTPPTVQSLTISASTSSTLTYQLTFSESVTGVNSGDFATATTGAASASVGTVSGSGASYTIVVNYSGGSGTVRLDLNASGTGIADAANNPLSGGANGQTYTINSGTWQTSDIGAVGAAGSYSEASGVFTVDGSGADIWGAADEFRFVYQQKSGDGTIIARVTAVENTDGWAKAGIMIRDSLSANAPHAMMLVGPANNSGLAYRSTSGGSTTFTSGAWSWLPTWIKLVRSGNTFTGYQSQDGSTWSQVGSITISLAANAYVGLAVTSHNDGTLCTATLDNVSLDFASQPSGWSQADVGAVAAAGSYSEASGVFTVDGSGADIWDTADEFHYVYKQKSGDGTFTARVTAVENTHGWAKAGIMIRDSLNANAPHAMMLMGPANNSGLAYRSTSGGTTTFASGAWSWLPTWIRVVRSGNTFTGYQSQDGTTWTQVGSVTITLAANAYVGLAVTSHNDGTLCTATIDNLAGDWP